MIIVARRKWAVKKLLRDRDVSQSEIGRAWSRVKESESFYS